MSLDDEPQLGIQTILELNDDCIYEIFKYLDIKETLKMIGNINPRIDAIAKQRLALYRDMKCSFRFLPDYTQSQLSIIGKNLKSINLEVGYSIPQHQLTRFILPLCAAARESSGGQLQNLTIHYIYFDELILMPLLNVASQLIELDLSYCQLEDNIFEKLSVELKSIKKLTLLGNYRMSWTNLNTIQSKDLESLIIEVPRRLWFNTIIVVRTFLLSFHKTIVTMYTEGCDKHMILKDEWRS